MSTLGSKNFFSITTIKFYNTIIVSAQSSHSCFYTPAVYNPIVGLGDY